MGPPLVNWIITMIIVNADADKKKSGPLNQEPDLGTFTNFAQMMVLINGLILTAVACVILSFFINDTLKEDYTRNVTAAGQSLDQNLSSAEMGFRIVSSVLFNVSQQSDKSLHDMMSGVGPNLSYYDRLLYVYKDGDHWGTRNLFESPNTPPDAYKANSDFQDKLVDYVTRSSTPNIDIQILTDIPGAQYIQKDGTPQIIDRPLALVKRFAADSAHPESIIIGLTRFSNLIPNDWVTRDIGLSQIVIRNSNADRRIFTIDWSTHPGQDVDSGGPYHGEKSIAMGKDTLVVDMDAAKTSYGMVLEKSPFIILFFGLALTAIGLMYVRSNQKQAFKLSMMNKALAQKNFEMNSEVTERERLNHILRKSERENRAIINSVSDIIFEMSTEGEILFLNETWEKVTGFEASRSMNRNLFDMLHPQDQAEQRAQFQMMVKGQKPAYRSFTRLRSTDGSFRSVELAISMLRQDANKSMRVVGTITDVEERRRAERALSEAEKKFRAIVENNASGIYQVTPEGQYLSANPALARMLGYESSDEFLRDIRNAHEQIYKDYREHMTFIRDLEVKGSLKNFETRALCKDGHVIWVSENARTVKDDAGNILYYEGSLEEITQRKEAEIQLREAKIESDLANRAKSEFLANMSHELRTPLNAIIGFSEIIKNEVFGPIGQKQYSEYANDIYASGKHLLKIINDVLDVARIEAGERQINEGVIDLRKAALTCLELVSAKIESGRLTIINMIDETVPKLIGEEVALKQMLTNLLSNAIKFTPPGGRITISSQVDDEGVLRLSVTDTGVGLDPEEIERAVSRMGQVDGSLSRSTSGTGLGLTLVNSLMQLHGGSFELFSQKGLGTTATLVFPVKRVAKDYSEDAHAGIKASSDGTISQERH